MVNESKRKKTIKSTTKKTDSLTNINALLKELIKTETTQEKYMKELLELIKSGGTFVKNPLHETETKIKKMDNLKEVFDSKLKGGGMINIEREISLDIPSLRIKDKFKLEDKIEDKVKNFEGKKRKSFFGLKRNKDDTELLKKMVTENLKKLLQLDDDRKQIIGLSYILRQFLEIKFRIFQTLTYQEMIDELKTRAIKDDLKIKLIEFFSKLLEEVYRGDELTISVDESFNLANQTIQELSKQEKIKKDSEKKLETTLLPDKSPNLSVQIMQNLNKCNQKIKGITRTTDKNEDAETVIDTQEPQTTQP